MRNSIKSNLLALSVILLAVPALAYARSTTVIESSGPIIEPSVASGVIVYHEYAYTTDKRIVLCATNVTYGKNNKPECSTGWLSFNKAVPVGSTYVGFRRVGVGSRSEFEIYYKNND